jgi:N-acetylneuraminic acid mutarotase
MRRVVCIASAAIVAAALCFVPSQGFASGPVLSWSSRTSMPTARYSTAFSATNDGDIIVFGGSTAPGVGTGIVERFHPATDTWISLTSMPTPRYGAAAVTTTDGTILVVGGYPAAGGDATNTVEAYDPVSDSWSSRANLPSNSSGPGAVRGPDGTVYVIGGYPGCCFNYLNTVYAYNQTTNSWSSRAPMPTRREAPAVALAANGKIYVVGGNGSGATEQIVEAYDPVTNTWQSKAPAPVAIRGNPLIPAPNGKLYVFGYDLTGGVLEYDPATDTWTPVEPMPTPRLGPAGALAGDGSIYIIGGFVYPAAVTVATNERARFGGPPAPAISGVSPAHGPVNGGTGVSITGTNFTGATEVMFGASSATSFTINSDTSITAIAPASALGTVDVTITSPSGTSAVTPADAYTYRYNYSGLFPPVDNPPMVNLMQGGRAVPVKFSLAGYQGLDIIAPGYPGSQQYTCNTGDPIDVIETTTTAGSSGLSYDAATDTYTYTYLWKTNKAWTRQCRELRLGLVDGSIHTAHFKFS